MKQRNKKRKQEELDRGSALSQFNHAPLKRNTAVYFFLFFLFVVTVAMFLLGKKVSELLKTVVSIKVKVIFNRLFHTYKRHIYLFQNTHSSLFLKPTSSWFILTSGSVFVWLETRNLRCSGLLIDDQKLAALHCVHVLSRVWFFATLWTVTGQVPQFMLFSRHEMLKWVAISFSRGSSWRRDQTQLSCVSCIGGQILSLVSPGKPQYYI